MYSIHHGCEAGICLHTLIPSFPECWDQPLGSSHAPAFVYVGRSGATCGSTHGCAHQCHKQRLKLAYVPWNGAKLCTLNVQKSRAPSQSP